MSCTSWSVQERWHPRRTTRTLPVHLYGQCAEMGEVTFVAEKYGLSVIEDAAQAIGATHRGRRACSLGHVGCLSFYPTKNLGTIGEGGMIVTNDAALAERCAKLRNHGETSRYHHALIGGNFRLDTLKAAVLRVKFRYLERLTERRRQNARLYDELLSNANVQTPLVRDYNECVYHQYSILVDDRNGLARTLPEKGIGCGIYYPIPLHLQQCFAYLGYKSGDYPVAERTAEHVLSLPMHPQLTVEQIHFVADAIRDFAGSRRT